MSTIYNVLELSSGDNVMLNTVGENILYDAMQEVIRIHNAGLEMAMSTFVERTTEDHKWRYKLPGTGRLQRRGGQAQSGAISASGEWDVAFPLDEFGDQLAVDRIEFGYMTVDDLDRHIKTVFYRNVNTVRFEILYGLFNNTQRAFTDSKWGNLLVEPLANGDAVLYPPLLGSETEATADHYIETGYLSASISDTNDPIQTAVDTLEAVFGTVTGGSNIVVFHNNAETSILGDLTAVADVPDQFITVGDDTATVDNPLAGIPGRVMARHSGGAWLSEWRWIPANYLVAVHLEAPRPLVKRRHPGFTGLGEGLQLVSEHEKYPFTQSHYEHSFGIGAGNRLNGVVLELGTGGTYTIPTAYA